MFEKFKKTEPPWEEFAKIAHDMLAKGEGFALPISHTNPDGRSCKGRLVFNKPDWNSILQDEFMKRQGFVIAICGTCGAPRQVDKNQQIIPIK